MKEGSSGIKCVTWMKHGWKWIDEELQTWTVKCFNRKISNRKHICTKTFIPNSFSRYFLLQKSTSQNSILTSGS